MSRPLCMCVYASYSKCLAVLIIFCTHLWSVFWCWFYFSFVKKYNNGRNNFPNGYWWWRRLCVWQGDRRYVQCSVAVVQSLSCVRLSVTPWTAAHQASLSFTISQSLLKLMSMEWWCHPTISSSVIPFSSCLLSFPGSRSFLTSLHFRSGGQSLLEP